MVVYCLFLSIMISRVDYSQSQVGLSIQESILHSIVEG